MEPQCRSGGLTVRLPGPRACSQHPALPACKHLLCLTRVAGLLHSPKALESTHVHPLHPLHPHCLQACNITFSPPSAAIFRYGSVLLPLAVMAASMLLVELMHP